MQAFPAAILKHWQFEISVEKKLLNAQIAHRIIHNPSDTRGSGMTEFLPPAALGIYLEIVLSGLI